MGLTWHVHKVRLWVKMTHTVLLVLSEIHTIRIDVQTLGEIQIRIDVGTGGEIQIRIDVGTCGEVQICIDVQTGAEIQIRIDVRTLGKSRYIAIHILYLLSQTKDLRRRSEPVMGNSHFPYNYHPSIKLYYIKQYNTKSIKLSPQ